MSKCKFSITYAFAEVTHEVFQSEYSFLRQGYRFVDSEMHATRIDMILQIVANR